MILETIKNWVYVNKGERILHRMPHYAVLEQTVVHYRVPFAKIPSRTFCIEYCVCYCPQMRLETNDNRYTMISSCKWHSWYTYVRYHDKITCNLHDDILVHRSLYTLWLSHPYSPFCLAFEIVECLQLEMLKSLHNDTPPNCYPLAEFMKLRQFKGENQEPGGG